MYSLTGAPGASWLRTGDYGDDTKYTFLKRITPTYRTTPLTGSATNYYRNSIGDAPTPDTTVSMFRARYDFRRNAHFHSVQLNHTGAMALDGMDVDVVDSSTE